MKRASSILWQVILLLMGIGIGSFIGLRTADPPFRFDSPLPYICAWSLFIAMSLCVAKIIIDFLILKQERKVVTTKVQNES